MACKQPGRGRKLDTYRRTEVRVQLRVSAVMEGLMIKFVRVLAGLMLASGLSDRGFGTNQVGYADALSGRQFPYSQRGNVRR